jgi:DNA polymerase III sliding clamp (beta) subunit (PCNA family)
LSFEKNKQNMKNTNTAITFEIPFITFKEIIDGIKKTVSKDPYRPNLGVVLLEISPNKIRFVSTNGFVLLTQDVTTEIKDFKEGISILIPFFKKAFNIQKYTFLEDISLKTFKGNVKFTVNSKKCIINILDKQYSYNNVEETFPDYKAVIPFNPYSFTVETAKLSSAIVRAALFANKHKKNIEFNVKGDTLTVFAKDDISANKKGQMNEMEEYYPITIPQSSLTNFSFVWNADFAKLLFDLLSDCKEIEIGYSGTNKAFVSSCDGNSISRFMLLMPLNYEKNGYNVEVERPETSSVNAKINTENETTKENEPKTIGELVDFVLDYPKTEPLMFRFVPFGLVDAKQAETIEDATGINVEGFERSLDTYAIRHILKNHGNAKIEEARGQVAITKEDFDKIPNVMNNPDRVANVGISKINQKPLIVYLKRVNGVILVVEEVLESKKKHTRRLPITSMRKYKVGNNKMPDELMQNIVSSLITSETSSGNTKVEKKYETTKETEPKNDVKEGFEDGVKTLNKVIEIDEKVFEPFDKKNYKEFSSKVNAFLKQYWRSENDFDCIKNIQSGFDICFDNVGIKELSEARRGETKMKALSQIKSIIEDAILFTAREENKNDKDVLAVYTFLTYIKYKDKTYEYYFIVKHRAKAKFIYAVSLNVNNPLN